MTGRYLSLMLATIVVILITALIAGCAGGASTPVSHGGPATDYVSLVDNLHKEGAPVEPATSINQAFFSVEELVIKVNGEDIQVFGYGNEAAAEAEAKLVSPDGGTVGTSRVFWVSPPHFYRSGKMIVFYVGQNSEITGVLEKVLGLQFAG